MFTTSMILLHRLLLLPGRPITKSLYLSLQIRPPSLQVLFYLALQITVSSVNSFIFDIFRKEKHISPYWMLNPVSSGEKLGTEYRIDVSINSMLTFVNASYCVSSDCQ